MSQPARLPPSFTSLYRLYLRTSSAAVLHHKRAFLNLKARWRPLFDKGGQVTKELQNGAENPPEWRQARVDWLKKWHETMDESLKLLYTSSQSRGLPHKLTRNLAFFVAFQRQRIRNKQKRQPAWRPQDPSKPKVAAPSEKARAQDAFAARGDLAIQDVIKMAEGTGNLFLGQNTLDVQRELNRRRPRHRKS